MTEQTTEQDTAQEGAQESDQKKIWWPEMEMLCTPEVKQAMLNSLDVQSRLGVEVQESAQEVSDQDALIALMTAAYPKGLQAISPSIPRGNDGYYPGVPSVHKNRKMRRTIFSKSRRGLPVSPTDLYMAQYSKFVVQAVKKLTKTNGA